MTYFLSAWVIDGSISTVETDTMPIIENHLPDLDHDLRIVAEINGDFKEAVDVLPVLVWDGERLHGVDFVSQQVNVNATSQQKGIEK